ncbi:long-chain-fatty-acid--CoA ligase [Arthrobacter sp. StoSoilA2]|uniref:class I adenylate-forming enzyme family protein n=1 Tax=Arthrobacter sp. StoSoilA2 TaxID=2830990 RepID=UPI001CC395CE|nr:AMP-binding protein [Arthrobacter sp. StoSoilA2]BCW35861.1 long-chain-fatty-acid--CoA ligase [Arthrobacter sp. StoSoilA2]
MNGLADLLPALALRFPDKLALVTKTRELSFRELDTASTNLAAALRDGGVAAGDRVMLFSENRWEWVVSYHAILKAGAVVNPVSVMLTRSEVAFIMRDAGVSALVASGDRLLSLGDLPDSIPSLGLVLSFDGENDNAASFHELIEQPAKHFEQATVDPESLACIAYTSGTTGHPKGAMQSQRSLLLNCSYTASMHVRSSADTVVTALPCPHVYGNVAINATLLAGGTVVLMERFDAAEALRLIGTWNATMFEGVPTVYAMFLTTPELPAADLSSLTRCTVGGQTISTAVIDTWEALSGAPLIELWGMTEIAGLGTTHALYAPNERGSIGVALPGTELRVANLEDPSVTVPDGQAGELMIRGPLLMQGYFNNPKATAEAIDADGWLHTGDVATRNAVGHFFVIDRLKDMILTGGYNVYPAEIERVMIEHDSVGLVAVGSVPDAIKGEVAHAYIVLAPGHRGDAQQLLDFARGRLAAYKVPRAIHFVDTLPTTSSGKLTRRNLRELRPNESSPAGA